MPNSFGQSPTVVELNLSWPCNRKCRTIRCYSSHLVLSLWFRMLSVTTVNKHGPHIPGPVKCKWDSVYTTREHFCFWSNLSWSTKLTRRPSELSKMLRVLTSSSRVTVTHSDSFNSLEITSSSEWNTTSSLLVTTSKTQTISTNTLISANLPLSVEMI